MRRRLVPSLAGAALLSGALVSVGAPPASADSLVATTSGTVVTVTIVGNLDAYFSCNASGKVMVGAVTAAPALACSALTSVHVNGDSGDQRVVGSGLDVAAFSTHPNLVVSLGDGNDTFYETERADTADLGPGIDTAYLHAGGVANGTIALGGGTNALTVYGTAANDTMTASSTNGNVSVSSNNGAVASVSAATSVTNLDVEGYAGNDTISAVGITGASSVASIYLGGGLGDDTLSASPKGSSLDGGAGTNVLNGSATVDRIYSASVTDSIYAGSGADQVFDVTPGRSGGQSLSGTGSKDYNETFASCDTVQRVRPYAINGMSITASVCRPGISNLTNTFTRYLTDTGVDSEVASKGVIDVVVPGPQRIDVAGDVGEDDIMDVTVPTGTWTVTGTVPGSMSIGTSDATLGSVYLNHIGKLSVHGPWTDKDQGFAHRVTRDLLFRFPTNAARDAIRDQLKNHTKTRAQVVASIIGTDEYRGLDVDRVFVQFLKRPADASGRAYWINGIKNGKSLRKFRAQLFGSNEYYAKAGGNNEDFVQQAYLDVLGRLPDAAGETYWINKLANGTSRGAVAISFLNSTESRRNIAKDQFLRFVGRYPSTAEADQWIATLGSSATGEQDLVAFLAASGSYYAAS